MLFQFVLRPMVRGLIMMGCGSVWAAPPVPTQLPTGGQVVAGKAAIAQSGSVLNVNQSSQRAAIDWQSFDVGAAAQVNFNQLSSASVTLNRVMDRNPSQIFGRITAPGLVFLVNPAGAYFAPSASVEVGSLMATTHSLSNEDIMAGRSTLVRNGATGRIVNEGQLKASIEGYIALLAPEVRNNGVVVAQMGTVVLAAGEAYTLQFDGSGLLSNVVVTPATVKALVENCNAVQAPGGLIILSAQAASRLQGGMVNNTGSLQASGLVKEGGRILLRASDQISHSGSMHADAAAGSAGQGGSITLIADMGNPNSLTTVSGNISAKGGTLGGDGGFVETSASRLKIADSSVIDTLAIRGKNGQWLLDPYDFTIAKSGGDLTGNALSAALTNSSVTIQTTGANANCIGATCGSGSNPGNGDIVVNDVVTWGSTNTLTLNAWRNIAINSNMTSSAGKLELVYGQNAAADGNKAVISLGANTRINLSGDANYSTLLGNDGITENWTVITALGSAGSMTTTDLQGINGNLSGNYVLGDDIVANSTLHWNSGAGFLPLGDELTPFSGKFDGLGHTISGLFVNRPMSNAEGLLGVGLFGHTVNATIRNVGLLDLNIKGGDDVGGLVGYSDSSTICRSFVTGTVTGTGLAVGGLVGSLKNSSKISLSYATANVSGMTAGGLVAIALSGSDISQSYATGDVNGSSSNNGGLVGLLDAASVSQSYATGKVISESDLNGGLVGSAGNESKISQSYASGAVSGGSSSGGLVGGINNSTIHESYAIGRVTSNASDAGGLVASNFGGSTVTNSFWDKETTGQSVSAGGGTGLTTAQFKDINSFTEWDIHASGGSSKAWRIYQGKTTPLLKAFLTNLTLSASSSTLSTTYDGASPVLNTITGSGSINPELLLGADAFVNANTYHNVLSQLFSSQQGYDLSIGSELTTLTIGRKALTYSGTSTNVTYNAIVQSAINTYALTGVIDSDQGKVSLSASTNASATNAGTYYDTVGSLGGTASGNYQLASSGNTLGSLVIDKATVSLSNISKTYDGTTGKGDTTMTIFGVDNQKLGFASVAYSNANVATTDKYLTSLTLVNGSGSNAGLESNYKVPASLSAGNAPATINKADYTAISASKTYNGNADFSSAKLIGVNDEQFSVSSLTASSVNASSNGGVSRFTGFSGGINGLSTGADIGNYNTLVLSSLNDLKNMATINKAPLTLSGTNVTVTYNGQTQSNDFAATVGTIYNNDITSVSGLASGRNASSTSYSGAALLSNAQGSGIGNYEISYGAGGSLTIHKANYTGISASKTYNSNADFSSAKLIGVNDEQFSVSSLTANSVNASSNGGASRFTGFSGDINGLSTGADSGNYNTLVLSSLNDLKNVATINKAPLTLSGTNVTVTYNGQTQSNDFGATVGTIYNNDIISVSGLATGRNASPISYSGAALLSNAKGSGIGNYEISYGAGGSLTINKAPLTVSATSQTREYNGDITSSATPTYGTLFGTDILTGLTQSYDSKNVKGAGSSILRVNSGHVLNDGNGGGNYEVTLVNAAGTITPAKLNITGVSAANKVYDGARTAFLSGGGVQVFGNDEVTLVKTAATGTFDTIHAGSAKLVSATGYSLSGSDVSNYALIQPTELLAAITPKALTIKAKNDFRTYDNMAYSGGNSVTYSGFVTGESESALSGTLAYGGTSQGAVRTGTYSISPRGLTSSNYSIGFVDGQLTIASPVSTIVTGGCATASLSATGPSSMACYTQNMQSRRVRSFEQFDVDAKQ